MIKLLLLIALPLTSFANDCHSLKETRIRLNTASFNFLNANTTRTEEGGPYLVRKVTQCKKGNCVVEKGSREMDTILKYEPDHPDANNIGYVRYPYLDTEKEWATVNSRAHHLLLLGEKKACNSKVTKTKNHSFYEISYKKDAVKSDKLLFAEGKLKSWEVEYQDGTTTITAF